MKRIVGPGFNAKVYAVVEAVPRGQVATYGDIAGRLGARQVARQVGFALAALGDADVPWHRIINAKGEVSGAESPRGQLQRALLEDEGVVFSAAGRIDLKRFRWRPTDSDPSG